MRLHALIPTLTAACVLIAGCTTTPPASLADVLRSQGYVAIALKKLPTGHETVVVSINGKDGLFVLDSGAGASVVHTDAAASFNLLESNGPAKQGTGAGGKIQLNTFAVASFAINKTALPVTAILVTNINHVVDSLKTAAGVDISGVIGQDVLTTYAGIIDVRGKTLYLKLQ
jgi:Aspartyl protease